jgi:hypothetical protein
MRIHENVVIGIGVSDCGVFHDASDHALGGPSSLSKKLAHLLSFNSSACTERGSVPVHA